MTPNPHPASGNGDVIERAVEAGAKVIAASPLIDNPQLEWPSWMGLSRAVLEASGLLKLSEGSGGLKLVYDKDKRTIMAVSESGKRFSLVAEGSGDGKMREALVKIRDFPLSKDFECDEHGEIKNGSSSYGPGHAAYRQQQIAREALATPAPSPIDTEGMREACIRILENIDTKDRTAENILIDACRQISALPTPAREIDREKLQPAIDALTNHQEQCDMDGVMVKVSRQALDEVLAFIGGRHG